MLDRANLRSANLSGTEGITNELLGDRAYYLEGATMPNGQKYEDWLKDKESRGEYLTNRQKAYLDYHKAYLDSLKDEEGRGEDRENLGPS
jgi:hypothetical protein